MKKTILFRTANGTVATLFMNKASQVIRDKGLAPGGDAQTFHTQNVLRRIVKYMPFLFGQMIKLTQIQTDIRVPEIVTDAPQAEYLFEGLKMVDPKINASGFMTPEGWRSRRGCVKVLTGTPLEYTKTKNKLAGPHWDEALSAAEGRAMAADLQRYQARKG